MRNNLWQFRATAPGLSHKSPDFAIRSFEYYRIDIIWVKTLDRFVAYDMVRAYLLILEENTDRVLTEPVVWGLYREMRAAKE